MNYAFAAPDANGRRTVQYFETGAHRAIYKDGWAATAFHGVPWAFSGFVGNSDNDTWKLYNIDHDFSQEINLAAKNPSKLKELQAVFDREARQFGVYPLDDRFAARGMNPERPSVTRGRTRFEYGAGATRIPEGSAPPFISGRTPLLQRWKFRGAEPRE